MKPITRKDIFLKAIAEGKESPIKPLTREEFFMAEHAEREADKITEVVGALNIKGPESTEGLTPVYGFYKVSDLAPTIEDFADGGLLVSAHGSSAEFGAEQVIEKDYFNTGVTNIVINNVAGVNVVIFPQGDSSNKFTKGVWWVMTTGINHTLTTPGKEFVKAKLLPKGAPIADVTGNPTSRDFNALLDSLRNAGYLAIE